MWRTISKNILKIKIFTEKFVLIEKKTSNFCIMQGAQNVFFVTSVGESAKTEEKQTKLNRGLRLWQPVLLKIQVLRDVTLC